MKLLYFAIYQIMINGILHLHVPSISKEQSTHSSLPASLLPLKRKMLLSIIEKHEVFLTDPRGGHLYFKNWSHAEHVLLPSKAETLKWILQICTNLLCLAAQVKKVPIHVSEVLMQFVHWLINESQNPPFNSN